ncbi:DNA polymerase III, subunit gamma and tau [Limnohabitans sp. JirII-29]|uniref:DNA polymerase III subunit gamma/tau n=1 Tax=unclassified Limnohabitans TaxID=2626134 RepID=UPI000C1EA290|nr:MULTISPECIES: DNA polymerase III subunit gamma/tau [unclassified Limnohabitans]PIT79400.1 DNA polymerase III, subunit gamma and tau [Limnohabitans sp. JirII-31]PUE30322.1 DNA polymerase III, subunit gamma and tau [Limnohabitans sp. JirII-29]
MSYLVLARKYRPRTFTEMVGQEHVVQALTNALTTQRLHHAYLFTGTRGVGKTTVSRVLAKSLNCQGADGTGGITAEPCGVCQACIDIDAGRFVDYTELDAASNRGVDEVQSLLEQAVYKPVQGRFKVFMIDEVHMLTNTAFNAMLKTLEEPPEYLKFVLATTDPQKVPVTVLSRCLQFNLRPMAPETVLEHLGHVLAQEHIASEPQALRLLARAARGSMRDALSLTDQAIAYGGGQLQEAAVRQMLGSADRTHVFRLVEALALGDGQSVVETSEALRVHGLSAAATLEDMTQVLQRMAVLQAVPSMAESDPDPEAQDLARLAQLMPADETQLLYSLCLHGRQELGLAPDEYAAMTMVLLRLLAFKPAPDTHASALAEKKTPIEPRVALTPPPARVAAVAVAPVAVPVPALVTLAKPTESVGSGATQPSGQQLPVRELPQRTAHVPASSAAVPPAMTQSHDTGLVAVPVRQQPEPSLGLDRSASPQTEAVQVIPTPEGEFWHALVTQMAAAETINALVRELALQSQLVARDTDTWMLRVERESLNSTTSRERLQQALAAAGHAVRLTVEVGRVQDSPAKRNAAAAAERQLAAEATILNDPYVQGLMRDYGARIVPGSIQPA